MSGIDIHDISHSSMCEEGFCLMHAKRVLANGICGFHKVPYPKDACAFAETHQTGPSDARTDASHIPFHFPIRTIPNIFAPGLRE